MPKSSKKKACICDKHDFLLKPRHEYTSHAQYYHVSFCSNPQDKTLKKNTSLSQSGCLNCPTFNTDNNFATPTFVLASEQVLFLIGREQK